MAVIYNLIFSHRRVIGMKLYLKLIILFVLSLLTCTNMSAQRFIETQYGDKTAIAITMYSRTIGVDKIYLYLTHDYLPGFTNKLKKTIEKFDNWSNTAEENKVKDYKKALRSDLSFDRLLFTYESKQYLSYSPSIKPFFYVDDNGAIFLRFEGLHDCFIGENAVEFSGASYSGLFTSKSNISVFSGTAKVGKPILVEYSFQIPQKELSDWIDQLMEYDNKFKIEEETKKQNNKRNKDLFK